MRIDLQAPVTPRSMFEGAIGFLRWWRDELVELLPRRTRTRLSRAFAPPRLYRHGAYWYLTEGDGSLKGGGVDASLPTPALRNALRREIGRLPRQPVTLELPRREVLVRSVRLPQTASGRIRAVAALQAERLSPFKAQPIDFDYSLGQDGADTVQLDVAVVPRATLARYREWAGALGLRVESFEVEDAPYQFSWTESLGLSRQQLINASLALVAVTLFVVAVAVLAPTRQDELDDATAAVDRLAIPAAQGEAARDELAQLRPIAQFAERALRTPQPLDVLSALTRIVPTSARLTEVSISGTAVSIAGLSPDPTGIVPALKKSGLFTSLHQVGPVVLMYPGQKHFVVSATLTDKLTNRWAKPR